MADPRTRAPAPTIDLQAEPAGSDLLLVARARRGDAVAFGLLYRRHVDRIYAFAARRLADRVAAEEATQETFFRALAGISRLQDDAAFAGWLVGIARNVVIEHHRFDRRIAGDPEQLTAVADPAPTLEDRAERNEAATELQRARERCLTARERELFDLLLADLTDREIAAAQGRSERAVQTARWRLVMAMRTCLGIGRQRKRGDHAAP